MSWLIAGALLGVVVGGALGYGFYILWVAHGEPDVNGDPERDGREP
jgi:multisubunit Na+/H+ antiporter MnhB subunit